MNNWYPSKCCSCPSTTKFSDTRELRKDKIKHCKECDNFAKPVKRKPEQISIFDLKI